MRCNVSPPSSKTRRRRDESTKLPGPWPIIFERVGRAAHCMEAGTDRMTGEKKRKKKNGRTLLGTCSRASISSLPGGVWSMSPKMESFWRAETPTYFYLSHPSGRICSVSSTRRPSLAASFRGCIPRHHAASPYSFYETCWAQIPVETTGCMCPVSCLLMAYFHTSVFGC
ncbi:hypothetical protein VTN02DRAFT_3228 [Thermoascus thermophilus]